MALTDEEKKERRKEKLRSAHKERMKNPSYCKRLREYQKAYRTANKEEIEAKEKAYREKNKEKVSARAKAYREKNKEKISERNREHRNKSCNKVKRKDYLKKYRSNNRDKLNAYSNEYYRKHKDDPRHKAIRYKLGVKARAELSDGYIGQVITQYSDLSAKDIPQSLMEAKRLELQMKRYFKEQNNEK